MGESLEPPALSRRRAWALALVATFTMAVSYVDRQTLAVLAPTVTAELRIDEHAYGWLVSAFSFAYFAGPPLAGRWLDRVGARRGLFASVLVWSLVAGAHALVPTYAVLFAMRIALGIAESPSFPGAAQVTQRALPKEERARALGILFTGSSFGAMVAPPLATALSARLGWRGAFIGTALIGLAWVPLWLTLTSPKHVRAKLDRPETDAVPVAARADWSELLREPAVIRAVAVVIGAAPFIGFVMNWGSKFLVREHGLTQTDVGRYLWIPPLLFDLGAAFFGHLASVRVTRGAATPPRGLLAAATLASLTLAAMPFAPTPLSSMLVAGLALVGGGGLFTLVSADMLSRVPARLIASAGGITAAAQSLAYIVANPLIGASVDRSRSYLHAILALSLWVLPGAAVWLFWSPARAEPVNS